jgi:hypothetical protein
VLKIIKSLKGTFISKHEGCGISGSKCLTPRLAIKCFQLLNEELLKSMYKPDGSITTISLDKGKGIMTQRYEKISESHSSSTRNPSTSQPLNSRSRSRSRSRGRSGFRSRSRRRGNSGSSRRSGSIRGRSRVRGIIGTGERR